MDKIKSIEELRKLREQAQAFLKTRQGEAKVKVYISMGTVGIAAGARDVLLAILDELQKRNFTDVQIIERGSMGLDVEEPVVAVERDGIRVYYGHVTPEMAREIVASHVINGQIVSDWVIAKE
ncbi:MULTISPECIES: (2Fe-2S) ferredoxin domain-containing protein [Caldisericum]|jgi:NADP-reducing hydrogenase subunit HndB|uniref:2Fe-2S ferredoxin n=1 Tax=Caldisericum exile TaxID=693075 RepID=A0A2J6WF44_9BACT|nr:MAG: 2Fe-2S ferredoxin [Caldisericum exile]